MDSDPRCCGTGTCIINTEGICWCGQVWDGEKMCIPKLNSGSTEPTREFEAKSVVSIEAPASRFKSP
jgi:hypothetical protein